MSRSSRCAAVLSAALLCAATLSDTRGGRIEGTVHDGSGAPLANAAVTVVGGRISSLSDSAGRYHLAGVPAGTHRLRVSLTGYRSQERDGVIVQERGTTRVDFRLTQAAKELTEIDRSAAPRIDAAKDESGGRRLAGSAQVIPVPGEAWNTENYALIEELRFLPASSNPRSTFSIDADAASYTNVRRFLTAGQRPPRDAVRIEEFLNYFRYDYPEPRDNAPFSVTTDLAACPWAPEHRLLRVGIRGRSLRTDPVPPSNLVLLLDVSGSMQPVNKLPLVKQAFRLLVQELRPEDRVAIVVYAGAAGLVLPSTPGSDKATILAALDQSGGRGLDRRWRRPPARLRSRP